MKIDNPNHPEHLRYQRIVDRMLVTAFYIFAVVGLSEVFNKPYYLSAILLALCTLAAFAFISLLVDLKKPIVDFLKGY